MCCHPPSARGAEHPIAIGTASIPNANPKHADRTDVITNLLVWVGTIPRFMEMARKSATPEKYDNHTQSPARTHAPQVSTPTAAEKTLLLLQDSLPVPHDRHNPRSLFSIARKRQIPVPKACSTSAPRRDRKTKCDRRHEETTSRHGIVIVLMISLGPRSSHRNAASNQRFRSRIRERHIAKNAWRGVASWVDRVRRIVDPDGREAEADAEKMPGVDGVTCRRRLRTHRPIPSRRGETIALPQQET